MSSKEEISNYLKELKKIDLVLPKIGKSLSSFFSRFRSKKLTIETEVKGLEQIEHAKQKLEPLPKKKTVEVKVKKRGKLSGLSGKTDGMGQAVKKLPEPPVALWSKMKGVFRSLHSAVNDLIGGLKNVTGYLVSSGGGALILADGFKSLIKIGQHFYNSWIDGMKEAAAMSEQNASSIREAAQANGLGKSHKPQVSSGKPGVRETLTVN